MSSIQDFTRKTAPLQGDPAPQSMAARVVEVGDLTAGIAVPEHGGVRFYSSARTFDALDGQLFGSFEQANRAARERTRPGGRSAKGHPTPQFQQAV